MNTASRELLAPRSDVWALVSEPYNLPDWWPAYAGVRPDRLGLAVNARWTVRRAASPGLLRRPGGNGDHQRAGSLRRSTMRCGSIER